MAPDRHLYGIQIVDDSMPIKPKGFVLAPILGMMFLIVLGSTSLCKIWIRHQHSVKLYASFLEAQNAARSGQAFIQSIGHTWPIESISPKSASDLETSLLGSVYAIDATSTVRLIRTQTCIYAIGQAFSHTDYSGLTVLQFFTTLNPDQSLRISSIKKMY